MQVSENGVGHFQTTSKAACTWEYTMLMLITYDISLEDAEGQARLRRVAKLCLGLRRARAVFGVRMRHRARPVGCFKRQTLENLQP